MSSLRNIKCTLAYDGTGFHGYQRQGRLRTVQAELETATRLILQEDSLIYASGRTDAGVHARGQVISFRTESAIPIGRLPSALNSVLPPDVAVQSAEVVPADFHARFCARSKTYRYRIYNADQPLPFLRNYAYHVPQVLDLAAMERAAVALVGTQDFSAFLASGSTVKNPVRTILAAGFEMPGTTIDFCITANGFLYNMVRIIVGTLLEVGRGKLAPADLAAVIASGKRSLAGPTAKPGGLYLERVEYGHFPGPEREQLDTMDTLY